MKVVPVEETIDLSKVDPISPRKQEHQIIHQLDEAATWGFKHLFTTVFKHYLELLGYSLLAAIVGSLFAFSISYIPFTKDEYPDYWRPILYVIFLSMAPTVRNLVLPLM